MENFLNKNIKFNAIKTKGASDRSLKGSFQNKKTFDLDISSISFFIQKNKEISLAALIIVGTFCFLNNFISTKKQLIQDLDQNIQSYQDKEIPLQSWQTVKQENQSMVDNFPFISSETVFLETISSLAMQQGLVISQYTPVPLKDEGFYFKKSLSLDCEFQSFPNLLMFVYNVETSLFPFRIEDIRISTQVEESSQGLRAKLAISYVQLKESFDEKK